MERGEESILSPVRKTSHHYSTNKPLNPDAINLSLAFLNHATFGSDGVDGEEQLRKSEQKRGRLQRTRLKRPKRSKDDACKNRKGEQ
jgi:hypothetical protein